MSCLNSPGLGEVMSLSLDGENHSSDDDEDEFTTNSSV